MCHRHWESLYTDLGLGRNFPEMILAGIIRLFQTESTGAFSQDIAHLWGGFTTLAMPLVCPAFYLWPTVDFISCGYRYWRSWYCYAVLRSDLRFVFGVCSECCVDKGLALLLNNSVFALGAFLPNQASPGWGCYLWCGLHWTLEERAIHYLSA